MSFDDYDRRCSTRVRQEGCMATLVVTEFITLDGVIEGGLPEGQVFHAAGPSANGWTIVAVHDSKESWDRFRDGVLMPRMAQGVEGGFAAPPVERRSKFIP